MDCTHSMHCHVDIIVFTDRPPLSMVELRGGCTKCGAELEFIGIDCGVNLNGPAVSPDQREVRLAAIVTDAPASIKHSSMKVKQ